MTEMKGHRFSPDRLANGDTGRVSKGVMRIVDALQSLPPDEQVLACGAVFSLACERFAVAPIDTLRMVSNMTYDGFTRKPEFRAAEMYMKNEW